jgi:hypothetical protein
MQSRPLALALGSLFFLGSYSAYAAPTKPNPTSKRETQKSASEPFSFQGLHLGDTLEVAKGKLGPAFKPIDRKPGYWSISGKVKGEDAYTTFEFSKNDLLKEIYIYQSLADFASSKKLFSDYASDFSKHYGAPTKNIHEDAYGIELTEETEEDALMDGASQIEMIWEQPGQETLTVEMISEPGVAVYFRKEGL